MARRLYLTGVIRSRQTSEIKVAMRPFAAIQEELRVEAERRNSSSVAMTPGTLHDWPDVGIVTVGGTIVTSYEHPDIELENW